MILNNGAQNEMQMFFLSVGFGQVWGKLAKNHSHPQKLACSYTYAAENASVRLLHKL